jgi:hypothetical protein
VLLYYIADAVPSFLLYPTSLPSRLRIRVANSLCVCVCACVRGRARARVYAHLYLENGKISLQDTWQLYVLEPGRDFRQVKTLKVSGVRATMGTVSVARKVSTVKERRRDRSCFTTILQKKAITEKVSCTRTTVKILVEKRYFPVIFNDTYGMMRPVSFRLIEIDIKCKHLWNFAAVTLRALYQFNIN